MALRRIELRDFVIVQHLSLDLLPGFTALTGETGAGKSILIDALQLALGAKAEAGVVRDGAARADIAAEFDTPAIVLPWLDDAGVEAGETLLLRRTIDAQGKSRAWINGSPATMAQLRHLGEYLLDVHGQHAWQSLVRPSAIALLLDAYARVDVAPVQHAWKLWRAALKALDDARAAQETLQHDRERLQWQIREFDKLAPRAGEWDDLHARHQRLLHAQSLADAAQSASTALADEDAQGARAALAQARAALDSYCHLEPEFSAWIDILDSAAAQIDDVSRSLHIYARNVDLDPASLAELDQRVSAWLALARRYRREPEELPALLDAWRAELSRLDDATDLAALQQAEAAAARHYETSARALSKQRAAAAPRLSADVTRAMQGLGMAGGTFEVRVGPAAEPSPTGLDQIEFLVAGHPGTPARPIGKVASGGELSRISLAIAVTTSQLGSVPTLIFDEVDSGIGGAVAETVGKLMQRLGQDRQVLAVTHLAQVAAQAHQHLKVEKRRGTPTTSTVCALGPEERVAELARMLGGERTTDTTLAHAREMLATAAAPSSRGAAKR